ncbi:hypothetical protein BDN70DRAFT_930461 [Pholiota conissans]|uniref:Uncharacterized protein n=1 Tax=Pholiota conissans TaxID=109636 RepID=A0A9P5Z837_9AGAR|nr:hypothetical protein BDN70DRAFT_930461 [Pholiota conissans]
MKSPVPKPSAAISTSGSLLCLILSTGPNVLLDTTHVFVFNWKKRDTLDGSIRSFESAIFLDEEYISFTHSGNPGKFDIFRIPKEPLVPSPGPRVALLLPDICRAVRYRYSTPQCDTSHNSNESWAEIIRRYTLSSGPRSGDDASSLYETEKVFPLRFSTIPPQRGFRMRGENALCLFNLTLITVHGLTSIHFVMIVYRRALLDAVEKNRRQNWPSFDEPATQDGPTNPIHEFATIPPPQITLSWEEWGPAAATRWLNLQMIPIQDPLGINLKRIMIQCSGERCVTIPYFDPSEVALRQPIPYQVLDLNAYTSWETALWCIEALRVNINQGEDNHTEPPPRFYPSIEVSTQLSAAEWRRKMDNNINPTLRLEKYMKLGRYLMRF